TSNKINNRIYEDVTQLFNDCENVIKNDEMMSYLKTLLNSFDNDYSYYYKQIMSSVKDVVLKEQQKLSKSILEWLICKLPGKFSIINFVKKVIQFSNPAEIEFNKFLQMKYNNYNNYIDDLHNKILHVLDRREKTMEDRFNIILSDLNDYKLEVHTLLDEFLSSIKKKSQRRLVSKTFVVDFSANDKYVITSKEQFNFSLNDISIKHKLLSTEKQGISEYLISNKIKIF
ncbi:hypothetical protein SLOPH_2515, partial [Spraguea lophii 42_110]